jgi:hypothetical protein
MIFTISEKERLSGKITPTACVSIDVSFSSVFHITQAARQPLSKDAGSRLSPG